ncbi:NtaA/DmoA family FMN-dependent monooxygenase [Cnuibacter physcomitrellae]|uniref:NtaA/DmoA family FMN-dependent monooxygenase n=1 Tax=Cnuibacter physcomitrellae TaxID=1619308 RepID=UPI00217570C2|nr:NtaA/DmoA family FMN-dependent monooxygenase [Cnuibacter physcomitrellae]MCS5499417.1 NtaA/DmoA family FMN-dependent monooxygenase [Cnuibacter physcomitrellae]
MTSPLVLAIFQYIGPNGTIGSAWQHPDDTSADFTSLQHWIRLAKKFEEARLDFLFFADSYGFPAMDGELIPASVREGRGIPHGDPMPVISALAAATERLGFVVTASTTVEPPAANARRFATLDHFTEGRIGWNIVTGSSGATAAALMGKPLIPHDERYDMADDYVDLSLKLWEGSWDDDALVRDKEAGVYADPDKVRIIHHEGPYFRADGLLNMPPSKQRTPLLVQAGTSGRGMEFAGKHAEAVFVAGGDPERVARNIQGIRDAAVAAGREPDSIKVLVGALFLAGATSEQARATHEEMLAMSTPEGAAAIFAGNTGVDLLALDPDKPLTQQSTELGLSNLQRYLGRDGKPAPLVRDIIEDFRVTGINGSVFVGTGEDVVDQVEEFVRITGADGFLIQPHMTPGTYDDFIEHVLPVLRARGLARSEYEGDTLRERLFPEGTAHLPASHPGAAYRTAPVGA